MSWWNRLATGLTDGASSRAPDYLREAMTMEMSGDIANALTSYRLALRQTPNDTRVLQNIAIAFSKSGQPDEAIRAYRRALAVDQTLSGAHYGLAFLLLRRGDVQEGVHHLDQFLRHTPRDAASASFVEHAERTRAMLTHTVGAPVEE